MIYIDPERFATCTFPQKMGSMSALGMVLDAMKMDASVGRVDDVINVSGHRLGTMEIESALFPSSSCCGSSCSEQTRMKLRGEGVFAFHDFWCITGEGLVKFKQLTLK